MSETVRRHVHWIDALKAIVVIGIALFHSALVFSPGKWIVNNAGRSLVLGTFAGFTFEWGIALLFLLSGAATWFGLRSRGSLQFARSRIIRLGIPLLVGLAVLSPLQSYFQHAEHADLGALLRTYVTFWTSVHPGLNPSSAYDYLYHLWFLSHLLAISILTLPLCAWLRSPAGLRAAAQIARVAALPAGFLLGAVPLAAVQMALHADFPRYQDWSDLAAWGVLYVEGFVIMSNHAFEEVIRRSFGPALLAALAFQAEAGILNLTGTAGALDAHPDYSAGYLAFYALRAFSTWTWLAVLLSLGVRWLDSGNALARWGADRPLPFYVISHPLIVVIAFFVVGWSAGLWIKFAVIAGGSIALTLGLCELIARRPVLRVLFGLSAVPKRPFGVQGVKPKVAV